MILETKKSEEIYLTPLKDNDEVKILNTGFTESSNDDTSEAPFDPECSKILPPDLSAIIDTSIMDPLNTGFMQEQSELSEQNDLNLDLLSLKNSHLPDN